MENKEHDVVVPDVDPSTANKEIKVSNQLPGPNEAMDYENTYREFLHSYATTEMTAEQIGEVIVYMAQYFAKYNLHCVAMRRRLAAVAQDIATRSDDNGKTITSAKAQTFTDATDEAYENEVAKAHLANIEQYISALRALQRGMQQEYSHQSLT